MTLRRLVSRDAVAVLAVTALALAVRVGLLLRDELRHDLGSYDQSVYYVGAAALLHGRLPYVGDFTFVHPPGILLLGLPAAALGEVTTADTGFWAANLAACLLGALVAGGVVALARRWEVPRWGAVAAGVVVATWYPATLAHSSLRLEPAGDALLVLALLALAPGRRAGWRAPATAGAALGLLVTVKLWWALPAAYVVVVAGLALRRAGRLRHAVVLAVTSAATALVVLAPVALAPGSRFWRSVVTAQTARPATQRTPDGALERLPLGARLDRLTGVEPLVGAWTSPAAAYGDPRVRLAAVVVVLGLAALAVLACRTRLGRLAVPLLLLQVGVLLATPVYFPFYGDYLTVSGALVVAAGAAGTAGLRLRAPAALPVLAAPVVCAVVLAGLLARPGEGRDSDLPDRERLTALAREGGCVVADAPQVLVALDAVGASLQPGCRNLVDVQGTGYGAGPVPAARRLSSVADREWRRMMTRYLLSGDTVALGDPFVQRALGERRRELLREGRAEEGTGSVRVLTRVPVGTR